MIEAPQANEAVNHAVQGAMIQLDLSTALAVVATLISVGTLIWKAGSDSAQRKAFEQYTNALELDRTKYRDSFEKSVDTRFAAEAGVLAIVQAQLSEVRENIAKNYMTKEEIGQIERRVTDNQSRILNQLDKIDGRLNALTERVLEAIQIKHG